MDIIYKNIKELIPYEKNAKKHDAEQIKRIALSLDRYGWKQPVVIDKDNVIVVGHGRVLGAKKSAKWKNKPVPCVVADDLTEEEIREYRLADNKLNESDWDIEMLDVELADMEFNMSEFGFELPGEETGEDDEQSYEQKKREFEERMAAGELSEDDEEYQEFLAKFEAKKTTDDCYTPPLVYEAVADYVAEHYKLKKSNFVRPFYPGGDYKAENYKLTDVVVDNPPFSIFSEIINYYHENGIRFFLFAPHLTIFSSSSAASCLICGVDITYENGANVNTSFVTNLEKCAFRSCPDLYARIKTANEENLKTMRKELPKYSYPMNVITAPMLTNFSRYGIEFEVQKNECRHIRQLDSQKEKGKAIYGAGYLISDKKKAEREKAEREKADVWELSERELQIIAKLK